MPSMEYIPRRADGFYLVFKRIFCTFHVYSLKVKVKMFHNIFLKASNG